MCQSGFQYPCQTRSIRQKHSNIRRSGTDTNSKQIQVDGDYSLPGLIEIVSGDIGNYRKYSVIVDFFTCENFCPDTGR